MAKSDLCSQIIKCLVLPAALIGTIQAAVWFTLSLLCILYYNNVIDVNISKSTYGYIIYLLYLQPNNVSPQDVIINSKRFNIVMYFYAVLSFIWLLISIYMVWMFVRKKWNNMSKILICWSTVTICLAIIDVSFMSVLASDLKKSNEITSVPQPVQYSNKLIQRSNPVALRAISGDISTTDISTAIGIVMSIAARGYILWIVNVVVAFVLIVAVVKSRKNSNTSSSQMPIIDAYERGPRPFSIYDQVEIDKSFQNNAFTPDEPTIFSPKTNDGYSNGYNNNNNNKNPLSNSNRSSLVYGQTPTYPFDMNKPRKISPVQNGKLAKIGKSGGRRSPPQHVSSPMVPQLLYMPYIPEPDYTPPGSPTSRPKGVLRPGSKYNY